MEQHQAVHDFIIRAQAQTAGSKSVPYPQETTHTYTGMCTHTNDAHIRAHARKHSRTPTLTLTLTLTLTFTY